MFSTQITQIWWGWLIKSEYWCYYPHCSRPFLLGVCLSMSVSSMRTTSKLMFARGYWWQQNAKTLLAFVHMVAIEIQYQLQHHALALIFFSTQATHSVNEEKNVWEKTVLHTCAHIFFNLLENLTGAIISMVDDISIGSKMCTVISRIWRLSLFERS